jgi:N-acetylmuramoyl-L-alanine amidase
MRQVGVLAIGLVTGLAVGGCALFGGASSRAAAPQATGTSHSAGSSSSSPAPGTSSSPGASRAPGVVTRPLAGKIVGIDPGHNGLNGTDVAFINHQIWNGREWENCNTTGTATASGYTEALFNWNVGHYLAIDLRKLGAKIVLTRKSNDGVGPCVNTRSFILNRAHVDVAISIHADGGPTGGRGFTVLEPVADGPNDKVIASSLRFGRLVHRAMIADTPFAPANYYGHNGYQPRDDLAGENLTAVPKVLIECGNMPNPTDAALLTSPAVQRKIARALAASVVRFLTGRWPTWAHA